MLLIYIIIFSLVGTIAASLATSFFFFVSDRTRRTILSNLISYAVGTLLAVAFLRLLPRAMESTPIDTIMGTVLAGLIAFFLLEKTLIWRHCHEHKCEVHKTQGPLILVGDAFHNFVDGVIIATAFVASIPLGIATALAVGVHEVPQEVGDFSILLEQGYSARRAFLLNTFSSLTTILGAILGYFLLDHVQPIIPYILAISAASFIYIATVDLIANMHRQNPQRFAPAQILLIALGVGSISLLGLGHGH